jgi:glycosyltransferase involved in cell wall biosynthesis
MIKLSAAMIVKNEEKRLARCLESIKGIVDEIVIVDTGSTDKTLEIAAKYTDKIFHEPWENDFSKHRNTSLSHCTGDWILQIDADEEFFIDDVTIDDFKLTLSKLTPDINAVAMTLRDWSDKLQTYSGEVDIPRLFRAGKCVFKRKIHNEPTYEGITGFLSKIWLKHYGYNMTPEEQKKKAERTIGLLKESLAADPNDHVIYFYLAQALLKFGNDVDGALENALEYFSRKDAIGEEIFNTSIVHMIASIYIIKKEYQKAMDYISNGLKENPNDVDLSWDLMTLGIETKNNGLVLGAAARYIQSIEEFMKDRSPNGMIGTRFYFHIDPHSRAAAYYWFAILQIESGITTLRKLEEFTRKSCKPHVADEIESRTKEDMRRLNLIDQLSSRIITNTGGLNGSRRNHPMGLRR